MAHVELELHTCPGFAFKMPPLDTTWSTSSKRDALCAEHLLVMNAGSSDEQFAEIIVISDKKFAEIIVISDQEFAEIFVVPFQRQGATTSAPFLGVFRRKEPNRPSDPVGVYSLVPATCRFRCRRRRRR